MKHVVLIGMMGAGKSTVGRYLAHCLGRPLYDTDLLIEEAEGKSIPDIFRDEGEVYFRQRECAVIRQALEESPAVLSLGGGAYMQPEVREVLRRNSVTFYLKASLRNLQRRVGSGATRPLLEGGNVREKLRHRVIERDPIYRMADAIVTTDHRTSAQVGERIIEHRALFD
jgi:shikimate kinase